MHIKIGFKTVVETVKTIPFSKLVILIIIHGCVGRVVPRGSGGIRGGSGGW
jgi:hypothetical protein